MESDILNLDQYLADKDSRINPMLNTETFDAVLLPKKVRKTASQIKEKRAISGVTGSFIKESGCCGVALPELFGISKSGHLIINEIEA